MITARAYPRVGLVGNPSDGFHGKTIAFVFKNFEARVSLEESEDLCILPNARDHMRFRSIEHLADDVWRYGYYGGLRLLKASVKRFHDYCHLNEQYLHDRNFTLRYETTIPHCVGLAGSSAIVTACFKALMSYYGVRINPAVLANLTLSVETEELRIPAGLQDRVAQAYGGLVYMDFDRAFMEKEGHGRYERVDPELLQPLYVAYRLGVSEGSEVAHGELRTRYEAGDPEFLSAVAFWSRLTDETLEALVERRHDQVPSLLNANFDMRRKVSSVNRGFMRMVHAARSVGVSAKFTGSGGAIVGTYVSERQFRRLQSVMEPLNVRVIKPEIVQ